MNLQIALGSRLIFTILILQSKNMIHFSIYLCYLWFLSPVYFLYFSVYRSFVSLRKFSPKYFIIFVAMVNGIVSLISLSDFSLLVYRNAGDFCISILYGRWILNHWQPGKSWTACFWVWRFLSSDTWQILVITTMTKNRPRPSPWKCPGLPLSGFSFHTWIPDKRICLPSLLFVLCNFKIPYVFWI